MKIEDEREFKREKAGQENCLIHNLALILLFVGAFSNELQK
jgi:hypothetical protein